MRMVFERAWSDATRSLQLDSNEVHVWKIDLDDAIDTTTSLMHLLSLKEREKAQRFYHRRDRCGYLVSHVTLRLLLGGYLGVQPETLGFTVTARGKPHLLSPPGKKTISFTLSHSRGRAVIAIAAGQEIGIDIEYVHPAFPIADAARQFLTSKEMAALALLSHQDQNRAFYRIWTMKEAYLKAAAIGMNQAMDSLEISQILHQPACCCPSAKVSTDGADWILLELPPLPEYASALAVRTEPSTIRFFELIPDPSLALLCLRDFFRLDHSFCALLRNHDLSLPTTGPTDNRIDGRKF